VFHNIDGRIVISGSPRHRTRAWIHNLEADPRLTFHLKGALRADLAATGRVVTDAAERAAVIPAVAAAWGRRDVAAMVEWAPLVEVILDP
jgi:hypothetical protein